MRIIRFLLASLFCALAVLPARAAWAAINVTFAEPRDGSWSHGSVNVHVEVSSTLQITRVLAQLGAGSVILTNTGGTTYKAGISAFGLPYGEHILTVTATDVTGASVSAQRTVLQVPLEVARVARPEGVQTGAYQLHAGYIAFLKGSRRPRDARSRHGGAGVAEATRAQARSLRHRDRVGARDRPELDLGEAAMGEVELDAEGRGGEDGGLGAARLIAGPEDRSRAAAG